MSPYKFGNKKAWFRVVEASIAVLILISFVMIVVNRVSVKETNLQEKVNELILKIEQDPGLRENILDGICEFEIESDNLNYAFLIEDLLSDSECNGGDIEPDKEIFASSIILTGLDANQQINYKKFTLYIWK